MDVGANLGWFTTRVNGVTGNGLKVYNIGLDLKARSCSLFQEPNKNKGGTHTVCDNPVAMRSIRSKGYQELAKIQTTTLDEMYENGLLGDIKLGLMKIDIEGYEWGAILGASRFLSSSIAPECINIEFSSARTLEVIGAPQDCPGHVGGLLTVLRLYGYINEGTAGMDSEQYCVGNDGKTLLFCRKT